jgi:hypothetical protein
MQKYKNQSKKFHFGPEIISAEAKRLIQKLIDRSKTFQFCPEIILKGHGNEADFMGFLQKLGPHRSLTLPFEPFRF